MEIYLAASWLRREQMRSVREEIKQAGHQCTADWLDEEDGCPPDEAARRDIHNILNSDAVIAFSEDSSAGYTTGGRHVEFGVAISNSIPVVVIGPRENIFHRLCPVAADIPEAIRILEDGADFAGF